jgi:hypothetical protein
LAIFVLRGISAALHQSISALRSFIYRFRQLRFMDKTGTSLVLEPPSLTAPKRETASNVLRRAELCFCLGIRMRCGARFFLARIGPLSVLRRMVVILPATLFQIALLTPLIVSADAMSGGGGASSGTARTDGRYWAFFANEGGEPANWTAVNGGWSLQPIDGLHTQTNIGDGRWFGTGMRWSPTPHALMMSDQYGTPGHNYIDMGQAATGAYNATWLSWLKADAAAATAPVTVVRIWQEINGDWMPWSINQTGATSIDGTPNGSPWPAVTIIAAFRNMAAQVRIAFPHTRIEWNLNAGGAWRRPKSPGNGTGFDLYPGDAYVDVIGLDAYEKKISWAHTVSGPGVDLNNLVSFATAHNKLVAISETAAHNDDGNYLTSMTKYFDALGARAAYISYYDQGSANNGDNIIYSTTGPDSAPALRNTLNASSFGTKPYVGSLNKVPLSGRQPMARGRRSNE